MTDNLEEAILRHINGDNQDPLKDLLMNGLNNEPGNTQPLALNDDDALTSKILNTFKGN